MTIGADTRTLAIVIPPGDDDGTFTVCLMGLDRNGEIDFDLPNFLLARTTTLDAAKGYSKGLADILRIKVLQIA